MRIYELDSNWMHEIRRDLLKRGKWVNVERMQDKYVKNDERYLTKELINYSFVIVNVSDMNRVNDYFKNYINRVWCDHEFNDRISHKEINPGKAWELRKEVWEEFTIKNNGKFAYTYNERMRTQVDKVISLLNSNPLTRQAIISIYDRQIDIDNIGYDRIPCSMYYQIINRDGKLHIIYNMRSCDIFIHYQNDIYLAIRLLHYVANVLGHAVGNFYMNIGSLHAYKKDIKKEEY